jgi:hypothetical protein
MWRSIVKRCETNHIVEAKFRAGRRVIQEESGMDRCDQRSDSDLEPRLTEELDRSVANLWSRSIWTAVVLAGGFTVFFLTFLLAIRLLSAAPAAPPKPLVEQVAMMAKISGVVFLLVGVVAFPVAFLSCWKWRPHQAQLWSDRVVIRTHAKSTVMTRESATWYVAESMAADRSGYYLARRRRVVVLQTPEASNDLNEAICFACGATPESLAAWTQQLATCGFERIHPSRPSAFLSRMITSTTVGGGAGWVASHLLASLMGLRTPFMGIAGWLDGLMFGLTWNYLSAGGNEFTRRIKFARTNIARWIAPYFLFGMMAAARQGWPIVLSMSLANAGLGLLMTTALIRGRQKSNLAEDSGSGSDMNAV